MLLLEGICARAKHWQGHKLAVRGAVCVGVARHNLALPKRRTHHTLQHFIFVLLCAHKLIAFNHIFRLVICIQLLVSAEAGRPLCLLAEALGQRAIRREAGRQPQNVLRLLQFELQLRPINACEQAARPPHSFLVFRVLNDWRELLHNRLLATSSRPLLGHRRLVAVLLLKLTLQPLHHLRQLAGVVGLGHVQAAHTNLWTAFQDWSALDSRWRLFGLTVQGALPYPVSDWFGLTVVVVSHGDVVDEIRALRIALSERGFRDVWLALVALRAPHFAGVRRLWLAWALHVLAFIATGRTLLLGVREGILRVICVSLRDVVHGAVHSYTGRGPG